MSGIETELSGWAAGGRVNKKLFCLLNFSFNNSSHRHQPTFTHRLQSTVERLYKCQSHSKYLDE